MESRRDGYDVFLAHASADIAPARELYALLEPHLRVFLDDMSLRLGDDWDTVIPGAQRAARVTVVLVSHRTDRAFYQREEVAAAIELARLGDGSHRVVPVYLEPNPPEIPYGLRLKQGLVVTEEVTLESVAIRLIDLCRTLAADDLPAAATTTVPGAELARADPASLVDRLFSGDPVTSMPAAEALRVHGPEVLPRVMARLRWPRTLDVLAVRSVLTAYPTEAAALALDLIGAADTAWEHAASVPRCLTPVHRPACENALAARLETGDVDEVRLSIEALGYVAAETWGHRLVERAHTWHEGGYSFEKFFPSALLARARMLVLFTGDALEDRWGLPAAFADVESLVALARSAPGGTAGLRVSLATVLAGCRPRHADHLITGWLPGDDEWLPPLAARALGNMRLRRALPHLATPAARTGDVGHEARFAIGSIGGADACDVLSELIADDHEIAADARWALAHCVEDAREEHQFGRLALDLLDNGVVERCWVYRAIGRRRDDRFERQVREALSSAEPSDRAHSALALARLRGGSCAEDLHRAYSDAGTAMERVFTTLALLTVGASPSDDKDLRVLRADLAAESSEYKRLSQDDIVDVLTASEHPQAAPLAAVWRGVYEAGPVRY